MHACTTLNVYVFTCIRIHGGKLAKGLRQALPNAAKPRTKEDEEEESGKEVWKDEEQNGRVSRGGGFQRCRRDVYPLDCGLVRESSWEDAILFSYVGIHCPPTRCPATPLHKLTDRR